MNKPFFLTPQIANLMEDFSRQIARDSSLFLLYGDAGVGKSRLLGELRETRLRDKTTHFVDFADESPEGMSDQLAALADTAKADDVIIFDHFESAPYKTQQQIFDSWSTDGRDKKLNFIVCADSSSFGRFRQLASQFQMDVKSFHLKPCDRAESEAFLQHLLYPEQTFSQLVLNASLKRLLRQSRGLFSRLEEFAEHHADSIRIKPQPQARAAVGTPVIVVLLSGLLVAGAYFILEYSSSPPFTPDEIRVEFEPVDPDPTAEIVPEPLLQQADEAITIQHVEQTLNRSDNIVIAQDTNPAEEVRQDKQNEAIGHNSQWLNELLGSSRAWITANEAERGTIQIMSLSLDRFKVDSFRAYWARLQQQGVDTNQLRLFQTRAGGHAVYSLMYGEFADRREANRKISELPEILRVSSPIPRSVGSIARELARLSIE